MEYFTKFTITDLLIDQNTKDLLLCRLCASRIELYHKIAHQKFNMFIECRKRVAEQSAQHPHKLPTDILNEMLADDPWISMVFLCESYAWYIFII